MANELKNYLTLERFSLRHLYFAYIDSSDYLADAIFIKHQVRVKFMQEYAHEDSAYRMIFCRIGKKDSESFLTALAELPNKMMICGHPDYISECQRIMARIESSKTNGRSACA